MLSDSESEPGSHDIQLTINDHFAKAYAARKEREELDKLKDKYGSDPETDGTEEDSEDGESEDEDGQELTPAVDAAILRTLAKIKRKDPEIYDKDKSIFEQEQKRTEQTATLPKRSPREHVRRLTIKQHAISSILQPTSRSPSPEILTHAQEQEKLRSETISAFHHGVDENDDGMFELREKTKDDIEREEEEYQEYLKKEVGEDIRDLINIDDGITAKKVREQADEEGDEPAPTAKNKMQSNKGEEKQKSETDHEFLMNYILNRGWIDHSAHRVPTYNDITKTNTAKAEVASKHDVASEAEQEDSAFEDEEFEDIVDQFESSYNFRFEEPDAAVIPTHPRSLPSIVRRQDTTRKDARARRKQRKQEELTKKKEEVKRMKALKMKELRRQLEQIGREGGIEIDTDGLVDFDLDGDWDPEKHDRQMAGLYEAEENEEGMEKPHWAEDIDVDDILPAIMADPSQSRPAKKKKKKHKADEPNTDGVDVDAMDADRPKVVEEEEWDGTEEMRKRKVQEYMDEVYGMEFNDIVGDMATRFNYTTVMPQSYALTPAEILLATDAELNEYMGIKRIAPYRKDGRWDMNRADRLKALKAKLGDRNWVPGETDADGTEGKKPKRKGKKERQRAKAVEGSRESGSKDAEDNSELSLQPPAKRRRKN